MFTIRDSTDADRIGDPSIRSIVQQRLAEVLDGAPHDPEVHGEFIVAEPGDTASVLEEASGCPILTSPFDGARFGSPDFAPLTEWIVEHPSCFELLLLFSDDGAGVSLFIPKSQGINAELLSFCRQFAEPAITS